MHKVLFQQGLSKALFGTALILALYSPHLDGDEASGDVAKWLQSIRNVERQGAGHSAASEAVEQLSKLPVESLPQLLEGFDGASLLASNWLRAAVDAVAERALAEGKKLPAAELESFVLDLKRSPRGRRVAYEWLLAADSKAETRLWRKFLQDPSLELRRDAVEKLFAEAKEVSDKVKQLEVLRDAFKASRDLDQVEAIAARMKELGEEVDVPSHFGFIRTWKLIGPFDNRGGIGFAAEYGPEKGEVDFSQSMEGKAGKVAWIDYATDHQLGEVDMNSTPIKDKGATAYAACEFFSTEEKEVEIRLGSIGANKVWVNGKLIFENDVYHSGMSVDQYRGKCLLKKGRNIILCKICQNEQTEPWAQTWNWQLRVCDELGTAILSKQ